MVLNPTFATVGAAYFSNGLRAAWRDEREIRKKLEGDYARTNNWHEEERELLLSLNKAIHRHFEKRDFSSSESEVALYLLKGLSLKEIADLRGSTQGTGEQQAHVLYHKAGLGGRAELSAFFLAGLLPEDMTQVDSPPRGSIPAKLNATDSFERPRRRASGVAELIPRPALGRNLST